VSELSERLEILRRIAERGFNLASRKSNEDMGFYPDAVANRAAAISHEEHLDLWQHLLNELAAIEVER